MDGRQSVGRMAAAPGAAWEPVALTLCCSPFCLVFRSLSFFSGIKMFYGPDTYYGEEVSVLEMDGQFDKLEELIYMESHLRSVS